MPYLFVNTPGLCPGGVRRGTAYARKFVPRAPKEVPFPQGVVAGARRTLVQRSGCRQPPDQRQRRGKKVSPSLTRRREKGEPRRRQRKVLETLVSKRRFGDFAAVGKVTRRRCGETTPLLVPPAGGPPVPAAAEPLNKSPLPPSRKGAFRFPGVSIVFTST